MSSDGWVSKVGTEDAITGTEHSLRPTTQYDVMEDNGTVLGRITLPTFVQFYQDQVSSVLDSERIPTNVRVAPEIAPFGKFADVPEGERRAIEATRMPHFGMDFNQNISLEDAKKAAIPCREELARKLAASPAESPTVRAIRRLMQVYEPGADSESMLQSAERHGKLLHNTKQTEAEAALHNKEREGLESTLSQSLNDAEWNGEI